ncbi:ABC1 kinase family protein [Methanobrevibacter sp.]|uniref:ABC1 kinase family protein n=1 Tax=Methanobrevibacter sp. TaxID=66852 RepID=UPI00386A6BCA
MKVIPGPRNKNIKRLNEIYKVLKKNDFGHLIEKNTFLVRFPFLRNSDEEDLEEFTDDSVPIRVRRVFEELGPAFIKFGQMLSTRPDLVGIDIADELKKLRDNTPVTPFDEMKEVMETELDAPLDSIFSSINENPIGSASIGQVYRATLKENDEEVAVKVLKPNSREIIESDIQIMKFLANRMDKYISRTRTLNLPVMVSEFEKSIFKEIDFLEEMRNIQTLANNFKTVNYIKIPKVYPDYCTSQVLTMELVYGIELSDLIERDYPEIDKKRIADYGLKSYFKQLMIDGFFHADPHPGNIIITEDQKLCYIDMGMMGILNDEFRENLAELILIIISGNTASIIKQLVYMGIISPEQNTDQLKMDVDELMNKYYGANMTNMDGAMKDLLNAMVKNNVVLPREFVMIGRGIALIEDTGKKLDPEFNATFELKKLSSNIIRNKLKPEKVILDSANYLLQLEHLAKDLPELLTSTIQKFEDGEVEIKLNEISELTNQISVALIIASLIIGSSLALFANAGPKIFDIPALGLIGFVFSAFLGIILVMEYMVER